MDDGNDKQKLQREKQNNYSKRAEKGANLARVSFLSKKCSII